MGLGRAPLRTRLVRLRAFGRFAAQRFTPWLFASPRLAARRFAFRIFAFALAVGAAFPSASRAGLVLTGSMGANSREHFRGAVFAYSAAGYLKIDDMTLVGIQSGQGSVVGADAIPVLGSALVRLPMGRVVLPIAIGDVGYVFSDAHPGLLWRAGGGFDIRNGRRSSFLLQGAYESRGSRAGWMGRAGLLLEF
jgi:hypothetical protein